MNNNHKQGRARESGSALIYILIAIALLAALTFTFMEPSSQQTSSQSTFKSVSAMSGQIDVIRSAIQECVLSYPQGDKCINGYPGIGSSDDYCTTSAETDAGALREHYPINPNSAHYTNAAPAQAGNRFVRNLRCPGNNGGENADHDNHEPLFGGSSGKFLSPAPDLFEDWQYYHGTDGVFFWTETDKTDAFIKTALEKLDDKFSECEADIIDAVAAAEDMDSDTTVECPVGSYCFRVWMIMENDSAQFVGDDDGDETTSNPPTQIDCSTGD